MVTDYAVRAVFAYLFCEHERVRIWCRVVLTAAVHDDHREIGLSLRVRDVVSQHIEVRFYVSVIFVARMTVEPVGLAPDCFHALKQVYRAGKRLLRLEKINGSGEIVRQESVVSEGVRTVRVIHERYAYAVHL